MYLEAQEDISVEPCAISPFQRKVNLRLLIGTLRVVYNKTGNVCVT